MRSLRNYMFVLTLTGVLFLAGCDGFFVSENSTSSVTFTPTNVILRVGESVTLEAVATTVGGKKSNPSSGVTWTSSNSGIAAVDASGKVTAGNTTGIATITATYNNKKGTGSMLVTLSTVPNTITVNGDTSLLLSSPNSQYTATTSLNGDNNFDITPYCSWSSSNSSVASVSNSGLVTARSTCSSFGTSCPEITASISTASTTLQNSLSISTIQ